MSDAPVEKRRCRESAPHTGSWPSPTVRVAPLPRSRMLTEPPLRVLNATFLPSGDQFGSARNRAADLSGAAAAAGDAEELRRAAVVA